MEHVWTYRSLSSAAAEASESLAVADAKRSSERSRSSSNNWMRRLRAATSDSACNDTKMDGDWGQGLALDNNNGENNKERKRKKSWLRKIISPMT